MHSQGFFMRKLYSLCFLILTVSGFAQTYQEHYEKGAGLWQTQRDSAYFHFEKALEQAYIEEDYEYILPIYDYIIYIDGYYYDLPKLGIDIERLNKVLKQDSAKIPSTLYDEYLKETLLNKANYFYKLNDFLKAKKSLSHLEKEILKINLADRRIDYDLKLESVYSYFGSIFKWENKYQLAEDYYLEAIDVVENNPKSFQSPLGEINNNKRLLASLYIKQGKYQEAIYIQENLRSFYAENSQTGNTYLSTLLSLTENYLQVGKISKAEQILKEINANANLNPRFKNQLLDLEVDFYQKTERPELALKNLETLLKSTKDYRNPLHPDVAEIHLKLAKLHLNTETFAEASTHATAAQDILEVKDNSQITDRRLYVDVLKTKLDIFLASKKLPESETLAIINKIRNTLKSLRSEYNNRADKVYFLETVYPALASAMQTSYRLYNETKESQFAEVAFSINETSKSMLLLEAIQSINATSFAGVPSEVIQQEQILKSTITRLENTSFRAKNASQKTSQQLIDKRLEHHNFIDELRVNYPNYYNLKYQTDVIDLKTIQKQLKSSAAIISYFSTEENLYAHLITNDEVNLNVIPFSETEKTLVTSYYKQLSKQNDVDLANLLDSSSQVYQLLLEPFLKDHTFETLTIVPDDILNYLPFETLTPTGAESDYLIFDSTIGYANSLSVQQLYKTQNVINHDNELLAFAPSFEVDVDLKTPDDYRSQLTPLNFNKNEVEEISATIKTTSFTDNQATLEQFKSNAGKYKMYHFATHASPNDSIPEYSYLAFTPQENTDFLLYVNDLYNQNLSNSMVVLSACETGLGKLQKGEGMLSLAQGFYYAGANALVHSKWKVSDQTTSQLMTSFYEYLDDGKSKPKALQLAKLDYLKTQSDTNLRHPFYWSAFVFSGDVTPVYSNFNLPQVILICTVVLLLLFVILWVKKLKA